MALWQPAKARQVTDRWFPLVLVVCALGCGILGPPGNTQYPAVEMPTHFGASPPAAKKPPPAEAPEALAPAAAATAAATPDTVAKKTVAKDEPQPAPAQGYLPDPPPLSERAAWLYTIDYDHGTLLPGSPVLQCFERPVPSARRMGRFAFELWLGEELVERVRFDFPLLAAETPRKGPRQALREVPSFAPGAHVSASVRVAASSRATRAQLLDRATGQTSVVAWPPNGVASTSAELCPTTSTKAAPATAPAQQPTSNGGE